MNIIYLIYILIQTAVYLYLILKLKVHLRNHRKAATSTIRENSTTYSIIRENSTTSTVREKSCQKSLNLVQAMHRKPRHNQTLTAPLQLQVAATYSTFHSTKQNPKQAHHLIGIWGKFSGIPWLWGVSGNNSLWTASISSTKIMKKCHDTDNIFQCADYIFQNGKYCQMTFFDMFWCR